MSMYRTFKNKKTGKIIKLNVEKNSNLIKSLEKDKMFKELMEL